MGKGMILGSIMLIAVLCFGCSEAENKAVDQRSAIQKYLETTELPFAQIQTGVYKQTVESDPELAESAPIVAGDSVKYWFAIYDFTSKPGGLYYTNVEALIPPESGLNTQYWSFELQRIKVGKSSLLGSVQDGMIGSRAGDSVLLFLTSEKAYGDTEVGVVPPNSAILFALKINEVSK